MTELPPRYCILSLPRSGTQWCEELLTEHIRTLGVGVTTLGEYFEPHHNHIKSLRLTPNGIMAWEPNMSAQGLKDDQAQHPGDLLHADWRSRLELLEQSNPELVGMTLRHFYRGWRTDDEHELFERLRAQNFKFISLTRDYRDSLLSWLLALVVHHDYGQSIWQTSHRPRLDKYYVDVERRFVHWHCEDRFQSLLNWHKNLTNKFGITEFYDVRYEHMLEDLQGHFGDSVQPLKVNIRTLDRNPYDYIENAEQIRAIVEDWVCRYEEALANVNPV